MMILPYGEKRIRQKIEDFFHIVKHSKQVHYLDIVIKKKNELFYNTSVYQKLTVNRLLIPSWSDDPIS